jgi:sugar lactone lactonase YvrE
MPVEALAARKIADGLVFGEGIRWRQDKIVLSDMLGRRVVSVDPSDGAITTLLEVKEQPNGLAVTDADELLVLSMFDRKILKCSTDGSVTDYADLSSIATGYLGDVVSDDAGNLYVDDVGSRVLHGEAPAANGRIIRVRPDGQAEVLLTDLGFPNGIVITADGKRLYLSQCLSQPPAIFQYDVEADGALSGGRRFVTPPGTTDGMGIDDADGVWACVASNDAGVYRYDSSGALTHQILIDGYEPIACSIGGPNGRTMAITGIEALHGKNIFEEMRHNRVRAAVFLADVPFPKLRARP